MKRGRVPYVDPEHVEEVTPPEAAQMMRVTGMCLACIAAQAVRCEHLSERGRMPQRVRPLERLQHMQALIGAGFDPATHYSPIEIQLLGAMQDAGLYPELQYRIGKYIADFAFPEARVVVEADGAEFHHDEERERLRDAYLLKNGWHVLHFAGWQIHQNADKCVEELWYLVAA